MSYEEMMRRIYDAIPELEGQLLPPKVVYIASMKKAFITFESNVLVGEKQFLAMERILREVFQGRNLAIRVQSPSLRTDFLQNITRYKQVLVDFLRRNYPASVSWINEITWTCDGQVVTLVFPDEFSLTYMGGLNVAGRMATAIKDIFTAEVKVELTVAGDQEARMEQLRQAREEERAREQTLMQFRVVMGEQKETPATGQEDKPDKKPAKKPAQKRDNVKLTRNPTAGMTDLPAGKAIVGRSIAESPMEIKTLHSESGIVTIQGDVFSVEVKELRGGERVLVTLGVTDYTSSVLCKLFLAYRKRFMKKEEAAKTPITAAERKQVEEKIARIREGINIRVRGECAYDPYARELAVSVRDMVPMERICREDTAEEKRVELHMHTHMSMMDGMASAKDLINQAIRFGHPAVAITDHGVLQAFPEAFGAVRGKDIKLIPGVEAYMIDDGVIIQNPTNAPLGAPIVVLDFESTGLNTNTARIIEIGAVRLVDGQVVDTLSILVNPRMSLPPKITQITGITDQMLAGKESIEEAMPKLLDFIGDAPIAAHNASYDHALMQAELKRQGRTFHGAVIDTLTFSQKLYPDMKSHRLNAVCKKLGVSLKEAHRAVHDCTATAQALAIMLREAETMGATNLMEVDGAVKGEAIGHPDHVVLLAATQEGLVNLNRLVSISHLQYFRRRPHLPRSVIQRHRAGLIVGSACESGELYKAVLAGENWDAIKKIARFYDYLEIQPVGNNAFLIRDGQVKDAAALQTLNKTIVALGEELGIPVVATGDVHFLEPHHAIFRAIIQAGQDYGDADHQPPLYFRTTDEMLAEFAYLGEEKAREVVIINPRKIADRVDKLTMFPKHPKGEETFQPYWPDAAGNIETMTWKRAKEVYGDPLPDIVVKRLEKELKSIIGYGFATLYNIAQLLVSRSMAEGYLVGSRGSVGSSLVAYMCGITEVNALPPHYRCEHCHTADFDVDTATYQVGFDLPDRPCPHCGQTMAKDGYDIPFEVFLGFEGDKVPDIDLNFSGEYQAKAHQYVVDLFGEGHVFRSGTISTLADKKAYGYVSKYLETRGIQAGETEKNRLVKGVVGVKQTTGQHPGGMVVVPKDNEIYQFTAVQHPADNPNSAFITTHFDFRSMHDILVKLDCLGHDDPTMINRLEKLTGISYQGISLTDPQVISLFRSPEALGVTKEDILWSTGTLGIPEFGTKFVRGILETTKPSNLEELVRIAGLSHGTDVWTGNAKDLIVSGVATLMECVCCRDDIMRFLLSKGIAHKMAFATMEMVRKGKGLTPEMEKAMVDHQVTKWFIDSCKKIKYMFPRGHAAAYVSMGIRIGWYKVYTPLAYYAAYFSIRAKKFDTSMVVEPEVIRDQILAESDTEEEEDAPVQEGGTGDLSATEKSALATKRMVLEMYMRGIRFLPIDLYKSHAIDFLMEDGHLRLPFSSMDGVGESAANAIMVEGAKQPFLSVEDLKKRTRISTSVIEKLRSAGALENLSETSQISMF